MTEKPTAPKLTVPYDPRDRHVRIEWNPVKPADCTHPRIASGTRFIVTEVTGRPDQRAEAPALRCRTCGAMFGPELPTEFQLPPRPTRADPDPRRMDTRPAQAAALVAQARRTDRGTAMKWTTETRTYHRFGSTWVLDAAVLAAETTVARKTRIHLAGGGSVDIHDERVTPEVVVTAITGKDRNDD